MVCQAKRHRRGVVFAPFAAFPTNSAGCYKSRSAEVYNGGSGRGYADERLPDVGDGCRIDAALCGTSRCAAAGRGPMGEPPADPAGSLPAIAYAAGRARAAVALGRTATAAADAGLRERIHGAARRDREARQGGAGGAETQG